MARHGNHSGRAGRRRRRRTRARVRPALVLLLLAALVGGGAYLLTGRQSGGGPRVADAATAPASASPAAASNGGTAQVGVNSATDTPASPSVSATSTPSAPPSASPSASASRRAPSPTTPLTTQYASQVLDLVNTQRASAGCKPLTADPALRDLAQAHSADMKARGYFSHDTPEGLTPWDRAKAAGITDLGAENIAMGQATPQAVMTAWMNSPGHRANILDCTLTRLGVGVALGGGGPWWTQDFGR